VKFSATLQNDMG